MKKGKRLILSGIILAVLLIIVMMYYDVIVSNESGMILLIAAILIVFFSLFLETFFPKPIAIIATSISIILLLLPQMKNLNELPSSFPKIILNIYLWYCAAILIISTISQILLSDKKSNISMQNRTSLLLKKIVAAVASSKIMYFILGIISLMMYWYEEKQFFTIMLVYFIAVLLITMNQKNLEKLFTAVLKKSKKKDKKSAGRIIDSKSNKILIAELFVDNNIEVFDNVIFRKNLKSKQMYNGIVINQKTMNEKEYFDILQTGKNDEDEIIEKGSVHKKSEDTQSRLTGLVAENTDVSNLYFKYISKQSIQIGDMLSVKISKKKILYQVISGKVNFEKNEKNDNDGFIIGHACQVGVWNKKEARFEKYGWIPENNMPIYKVNEKSSKHAKHHRSAIGVVPNTKYEIEFDFDEGIKNHLAILGDATYANSALTKNIIDKIRTAGTKVIMVDFTGQYRNLFEYRDIYRLFANDFEKQILENNIEYYANQMEKTSDRANQNSIDDAYDIIKDSITVIIEDFLRNDSNAIGLLEYPDMTKNTLSISLINWLFVHLLNYTRDHFGEQRICIVLQEAQTIVPEFASVESEDAKTIADLIYIINKIAMQSRKYEIGFVVLAQRAANVSKTILNQCNSVIAFQQSDDTSKDFLSNYLSPELIAVLPNLRQTQAIVSGKGLSSSTPVIIEIPVTKDEKPENIQVQKARQTAAIKEEISEYEPPLEKQVAAIEQEIKRETDKEKVAAIEQETIKHEPIEEERVAAIKQEIFEYEPTREKQVAVIKHETFEHQPIQQSQQSASVDEEFEYRQIQENQVTSIKQETFENESLQDQEQVTMLFDMKKMKQEPPITDFISDA